jgi:hypothetical protein
MRLVGLSFLVGLLAACGDADPAVFPTSATDDASSSTTPVGDDSSGTSATPTSDDTSGMTTSVDPDTSSDGGSTTGPAIDCLPPPPCDAPPPNPGPNQDWNDGESPVVVAVGDPVHRGRDMFYNPGDPQWVLAKFAYGLNDWDLEGERVDLFLLRGCGDTWESLGTTTTTYEGEHEEIEGIVDTGGRVYFQIPAAQTLEVGRHRIAMFVRGDGSHATVDIEIVEPGTPFFLADIDGTLTTTETEEFTALLSGVLPEVNPNAPEALWELVFRGYRPMYLTARPEFLGARTLAFVEARGLPPGIIHTSLNYTGALGDVAVEYKSGELAMLAARGLVPHWVFGNTSSDADAYEAGGIQPLAQRIFFQFDDEHGGRRIEDYAELLGEFDALEPLCE